MENIIENTLQKNNIIMNSTELLNDSEVIGLYFSGEYCPPCRKFTPILAEMYDVINDNISHLDAKKMQIIFIASDKSEEAFNNYYSNMPWLALPYKKRDLKNELCEKYNVKTIPKLIFLNRNGETICRDGRNLIQDNTNNIDIILNKLNLH